MWFIHNKTTDKFFYLCGSCSDFIIGRGNVSIPLKDDSSISREHAILRLKRSETRTRVVLIDKGSKYGTYINNGIESKTRVPSGEEIDLNHDDCIRFGILSNTWTLAKKDFNTATSAFSQADKNKVKEIMKFLDGHYEELFSSSCTHLTVPFLSLTVKLVQALVAAVPIITMDYWVNVASCIKLNKPLPKEESFLPHQAEPLIKCDSTILLPRPERRHTFKQKTFVFLSTRQHSQFEQIINEAQGKAILLAKSKLTKAKLCESGMIVVQYLRSMNSQSSQSSQMADEIDNVLQKKKLRLIPESEIGLAILFCNVEKYCNPAYDFKMNFLQQNPPIVEAHEILAEETEPSCVTNKNKVSSSTEFITPIADSDDKMVISSISDEDGTKTSTISSTAAIIGNKQMQKDKYVAKPNISLISGVDVLETPSSNQKIDDSIITFNKPRKRNVDCAEICIDSDLEGDLMPPTKIMRNNDDNEELFCFEDENNIISAPQNKKCKTISTTASSVDRSCNMTPIIIEKSSERKKNPIKTGKDNSVQLEFSVSNITDNNVIANNSSDWLSCNGNSIQMDISEKQKNASNLIDISSEHQEWITTICEGISIERKKLCKRTSVVEYKTIQSNPSCINYKYFRKVRPLITT